MSTMKLELHFLPKNFDHSKNNKKKENIRGKKCQNSCFNAKLRGGKISKRKKIKIEAVKERVRGKMDISLKD